MGRQNWKPSARRGGETECIITVITVDILMVEGTVDKLDT